MLIPRRLPRSVVEERITGDAKLGADKGQHPLRDHFAWLYQPARISQSTELERKAKPILRSPPSPDMDEINVAEKAVPDNHVVVDRQIKQGGALPGGKDGASWHDLYLFKNQYCL